MHIEWYIPTDTNGILSGYTISYTVDDGSENNLTVPFNGQNVSWSLCDNAIVMYNIHVMQVQHYNITGLSPNQLVTVTITATNGAGTSEPSNEISGRTNEAGTHDAKCLLIVV